MKSITFIDFKTSKEAAQFQCFLPADGNRYMVLSNATLLYSLDMAPDGDYS